MIFLVLCFRAVFVKPSLRTSQGYITRQEAVSMIPPLLLDVKPHHKVGVFLFVTVLRVSLYV